MKVDRQKYYDSAFADWEKNMLEIIKNDDTNQLTEMCTGTHVNRDGVTEILSLRGVNIYLEKNIVEFAERYRDSYKFYDYPLRADIKNFLTDWVLVYYSPEFDCFDERLAHCAVCDKPIDYYKSEYALHFLDDDLGSDKDKVLCDHCHGRFIPLMKKLYPRYNNEQKANFRKTIDKFAYHQILIKFMERGIDITE